MYLLFWRETLKKYFFFFFGYITEERLKNIYIF